MAGYDFTNKRFGKLTAIKIAKKDDSGHNYWQCNCDCGNVIVVRATELINGKTTMCKDCKKKSISTSIKTSVVKKDNVSSNNSTWLEDNNISYRNIHNYDNIYDMTKLYDDTNISILSAPIIYKIVHCINADLSFSEKTYIGNGNFTLSLAGELNEFFHISNQLEDLQICDWEVGDVIYTAPVYNLLTKLNRNDTVSYDSLYSCLLELYNKAVKNNDYYLAFPKIACGKDKLDWNIVSQMIVHIFGEDFNILLF